MFFFGLPNIKNKNYPIHKLLIFCNIFIFYYVIQIIKKIKKKCDIDLYLISQNSLMMGIYCILGYSLYVDFIYWDKTKNMFGDIKTVDITKRYLIVATIITLFVLFIKLSELIFNQKQNDCDN
jgi:ABC-type Mn2+/Zn2+ transport system permease subunit